MINYSNRTPESVQSLPTLSFDSFSIYQRPLSTAFCLPLILLLLVYFLVLIGNHLTFVCGEWGRGVATTKNRKVLIEFAEQNNVLPLESRGRR